MALPICTFKVTSARHDVSNIFHTLSLKTHLPQNEPPTLVLEMNPILKKKSVFIFFFLPSSAKRFKHQPARKISAFPQAIALGAVTSPSRAASELPRACVKVTYQAEHSKPISRASCQKTSVRADPPNSWRGAKCISSRRLADPCSAALRVASPAAGQPSHPSARAAKPHRAIGESRHQTRREFLSLALLFPPHI